MTTDYTILLKQPGNVGVMPTDTVYGIVARAQDKTAVRRLYALKKREDKPGTVIGANIEQLLELGLKKADLAAASKFWPGPVSVVLPSPPDRLSYLHLGKKSLAVRIPNDESIHKLLLATGPLLTTSANLPGNAPAVNVIQAKKYFGQNVVFYHDGGDLSGRSASQLMILDEFGDFVCLR